MSSHFVDSQSLTPKQRNAACPIYAVTPKTIKAVIAKFDPAMRAWVKQIRFAPKPGAIALLPDQKGKVSAVLLGLGGIARGDGRAGFLPGNLPGRVPDGLYRLADGFDDPNTAALMWALGSYRFNAFKKVHVPKSQLLLPAGSDKAELDLIVDGVKLTRDLINLPANHMGPDELEQAARKLARKFKARFSTVTTKTLEEKFPLIHAVGKASDRAPRLLDFTWGKQNDPKVTLVGKGVCFDTGGLNLKVGKTMALMKKDMGGAANVLGLASMIMAAKLPIRLRVLVPAVENSMAGNAVRPSDIITSRKGLNVEIGNTDAEGRLVLADALALADEETPEILIDMATLTGAARIALGPDLAPFYCDDDDLSDALMASGTAAVDPLWRMPLWKRYDGWLDSRNADVSNIAEGAGFAGSIIAALFLKRFVERARVYVHFDIFGWTRAQTPGRPYGGEAHAIRAIYAVLKQRYKRKK